MVLNLLCVVKGFVSFQFKVATFNEIKLPLIWFKSILTHEIFSGVKVEDVKQKLEPPIVLSGEALS